MQKSRIIWIIGENALEGMELASHFKSQGHIPLHLYTHQEVLAQAKQEFPDLVIVNSDSGNNHSIELMRHLKKIFNSREVPFLFIGSPESPEIIAKILDAGAFDYIRKPYSLVELNARVQSAIRKKDIYQDLYEKNDRLRKLSVTDSLTGLYNHRFLMEQIERNYNLHTRFRRTFSFIMLDIDHFKKVNDSFGHIMGDQVLIELSNTLTKGRRNTDIVGRYGGEEFGLLLPEISPENSEKVARKIIYDVRNLVFHPRHNPSLTFGISVSLGITHCPDEKIASSEDVIQMADLALYKAKELGGNIIIQNRNGQFKEIEFHPEINGKKEILLIN